MDFCHGRIRMVLLSLVFTSVGFLVVTANHSETRQNCKELFCPARSCNSTHPKQCVKNGPNVTIWLEESERDFNGILVIFNKSGCEAFLLSKAKAREITESFKGSLRKHCSVTNELYVEIQAAPERKEISRGDKIQGMSSRLERGFKIIFKCQHCPKKQYSAFISITRNTNGSISAHACLESCKTKQGICRCSLRSVFTNLASDSCGANSTNTSKSEPNLSGEEGINRKTVKHDAAIFCAVLLCLLMEILVCVVLHLWLWDKYRGTWTLEVENSTSNPSYQQSLHLPNVSNSLPVPVNQQESYQPLVVNTRGPGVSVQYRDLTAERDEDHRVKPAADPGFYQDLVQHGSQDTLNQDDMTQGEKTEEPLYYVLEEPVPTKEDPRSPRHRSSFSGSTKDPLYYVLKELRSLNATGANRVPSHESLAEPIYYVLENPNDLEERNTQEDKL